MDLRHITSPLAITLYPVAMPHRIVHGLNPTLQALSPLLLSPLR